MVRVFMFAVVALAMLFGPGVAEAMATGSQVQTVTTVTTVKAQIQPQAGAYCYGKAAAVSAPEHGTQSLSVVQSQSIYSPQLPAAVVVQERRFRRRASGVATVAPVQAQQAQGGSIVIQNSRNVRIR